VTLPAERIGFMRGSAGVRRVLTAPGSEELGRCSVPVLARTTAPAQSGDAVAIPARAGGVCDLHVGLDRDA